MLDERVLAEALGFRRDRDWEQFHTPKNLAIGISVEAAELLAQFQWTEDSGPGSEEGRRMSIRHEIADVALLLSYLAHDLGIDLDDAVREKLRLNALKYPIELSRGSPRKYTELNPYRSVD